MKINKFILKISHFFGFRKQEEHIDNIIINANKYYKEQLHYTNIAIKWINGLQISKKGQIKKYFVVRFALNRR